MLARNNYWFILLIIFSSLGTLAQKPTASEAELRKQADKNFSNSNYEDATPMYSQLLSLFPLDPTLNYRYGVCLIESAKEKTPAIVYLDFACKKPPVPEDAWLYLGKAHMFGGNYSKATEAFTTYKSSAQSSKSKKVEIDLLISNSQNAETISKSRKSVAILNSKEVKKSGFYQAYDYSEAAGKLIPTASQFLTTQDKDKQMNPLMFMSKDGQTVYYSSYGRGGSTGKDIYMVRKMVNGQWGVPENLGMTLNSVENEDYPYLDRDGRTLYFCSRGHNSIGGYDLFKSSFDYNTNQWTVPENLGIPVNTVDDDLFFVPNLNGDKATYSTAYESKFGNVNIRQVDFGEAINRFAIISGTYFSLDQATRRDARITVLRASDNAVVNSVRTDPKSGKYELVLSPGNDYILIVEGGSYLPHAEQFSLPDLAVAGMRQEVKLNRDKEKEQMTVSNYFTPLGTKLDEPVLAFKDSPTDVATSSIYSSGQDSTVLMPVRIDDKVVYINDPKQIKRADESVIPAQAQNVANYGFDEKIVTDQNLADNTEPEKSSLPSIKLDDRDRYDPTLEKKLSDDELRQIEEEKERALIIEEEEKNPTVLIDFNIDNDELAQIALEDAASLQEESEKMKERATALKTNADLQDSLASSLEVQAASLSNDNERQTGLRLRASELKEEAISLNRQASDLQLLASIKMDESRAAKTDAEAILRSSGRTIASAGKNEKKSETNSSNKQTVQSKVDAGYSDNIDINSDPDVQDNSSLAVNNTNTNSEKNSIESSDNNESNIKPQSDLSGRTEDLDTRLTSEKNVQVEVISKTENPAKTEDKSTIKTAPLAENKVASNNLNTQSPDGGAQSKSKLEPATASSPAIDNTANQTESSNQSKAIGNVEKEIQEIENSNSGNVSTPLPDKQGPNSTVSDNQSTAHEKDKTEQSTTNDQGNIVSSTLKDPDSSTADLSMNKAAEKNAVGDPQSKTELSKTNEEKVSGGLAIASDSSPETDSDIGAGGNSVEKNQNNNDSRIKDTNGRPVEGSADITVTNMQNEGNGARNTVIEEANTVQEPGSETTAISQNLTEPANSISNDASQDIKEVTASNVDLASADKSTISNQDKKADSTDELVAITSKTDEKSQLQKENPVNSTESSELQNDIKPAIELSSENGSTLSNSTGSENKIISNTEKTISNQSAVANQNLYTPEATNVEGMKQSNLSTDIDNKTYPVREKFVIPAEKQTELEPEAKIVYNAYEQNIQISETLFKQSRKLQDRVLAMPRSPERDSLLQVSNSLSRQSENQFDLAQNQLQDAIALEPQISEMLVVSKTAITPVTTLAENDLPNESNESLSINNSISNDGESLDNTPISNNQNLSDLSSNEAETKNIPGVNESTPVGNDHKTSDKVDNSTQTNIPPGENESDLASSVPIKNDASAKSNPGQISSDKNEIIDVPASTTSDQTSSETQTDQLNEFSSADNAGDEKILSSKIASSPSTNTVVSKKQKGTEANPNEPLRRAGEELADNVSKDSEFSNENADNSSSDISTKNLESTSSITNKAENKAVSDNSGTVQSEDYKPLALLKVTPGSIEEERIEKDMAAGIDVDHPKYMEYQKVQDEITNSQVETINLFAEGVNLNKKAVEEKQQQVDLLDSAQLASDESTRESLKAQAEVLRIESEKNQELSREKLNASQAKTHVVKSLTSEMETLKMEISREPLANAGLTGQKNSSVNSNAELEITQNNTTQANKKSQTEKTNQFAINNNASNTGSTSNLNEATENTSLIASEELERLSIEMYSKTRGPAYTDLNPIPLNPGLPNGLVFKIQIGAFRKPIPDDSFKNLQPVSAETTRPGWLRYCVGLFKTFEPANLVKKELRRTGYKDAFVVAYFNGERISLQEANAMLNREETQLAYKGEMKKEISALRQLNVIPQTTKSGPKDEDEKMFYGNAGSPSLENIEDLGPLMYSVQVGVYRTSNPPSVLSPLEPIYTESLSRGLYRFTSGRYNDRADAESAKTVAVATGVPDAFVVTVRGAGNISTAVKPISRPETRTSEISREKHMPDTKISEPIEAPIVETDGLHFKVQLGAFKQNVPFETVEAFLKISDKGIVRVTDERGLNIFYAGDFENLEDARQLQKEIIEKGVRDAFVVVISNGKRIPLSSILPVGE